MDGSRSSTTRSATGWIVGVGILCATVGGAAAQTRSETNAGGNGDEIVVVARRSGIPVWRVSGPRSTVVLVGSIGSVAPGTQWDPTALDEALARADRVMFPEAIRADLGLFSVIGLLGKWRAQATLPRGQTLQALVTPQQWARLLALRERGVLKTGFERTHPYHLANSLQRSARDRRKSAPGANVYVRRYLKRNEAKAVPVARSTLKELTAEFFGSDPREHVACLMDTVRIAEAGEAGIRARAEARDRRSAAWAARRVPEALEAGALDEQRSCWPRGSRLERSREASVGPTIRSLLDDPRPTLAVVSLDTLARHGGVLDDLAAAGFDVRGPRWRR